MKPYVPWKRALSELRKAMVEHELKDKSIVETALQLMDQVSVWFSELVKYNGEGAFTRGLAAFLIAALISAYSPKGLPIALLVGLAFGSILGLRLLLFVQDYLCKSCSHFYVFIGQI